jgi:hypothetical protein
LSAAVLRISESTSATASRLNGGNPTLEPIKGMKQSKLFPFILATLAQTICFAAEVKNESKIQLSAGNPYGPPEFRAASICKGEVQDNIDLKSVELSREDLKKGVPCVTGDFDRNGYLDVMLYGNVRKADQRRYSLIIYFKKSVVLRTQVIEGTIGLFGNNDSEREKYPKFKNVSGLIKYAEGDRGVVFFFNQKEGIFKEVPYIYPKNYEMGE